MKYQVRDRIEDHFRTELWLTVKAHNLWQIRFQVWGQTWAQVGAHIQDKLDKLKI